MNHKTHRRMVTAAACAVALTGLAAPARSEDPAQPTAGAWQLKEEVSSLDGGTKISGILKSANAVPNSIGNVDHAYLIIRCRDGQLVTYFSWPAYMGSGPAPVRWKIDQGSVMSGEWATSDSGNAIGFFRERTARDFITKLAVAKTIVVEAAGYQSAPHEARFDLDGVSEIAAKAIAACPGR